VQPGASSRPQCSPAASLRHRSSAGGPLCRRLARPPRAPRCRRHDETGNSRRHRARRPLPERSDTCRRIACSGRGRHPSVTNGAASSSSGTADRASWKSGYSPSGTCRYIGLHVPVRRIREQRRRQHRRGKAPDAGLVAARPYYNGPYGQIEGTVTVQRSSWQPEGTSRELRSWWEPSAHSRLVLRSVSTLEGALGKRIGSEYGNGHVAYSYEPEIVNTALNLNRAEGPARARSGA
jgi:hypothetical protein